MKMINGLTQELKKTVFSYGFAACMLISAVMFMQTNIYTDHATGRVYSVMESVFGLSASVYGTDACFERKNMFLSVLNSSTMLFVPIIVSFPSVPDFCSERRSGLMRFTITRMGKMRYYFVKYFSALFGGGLAYLAGYLLYGIFVWIYFPAADTYAEAGLPVRECSSLQIFLSMAGIFLFGMASVLPAVIAASFIKNKYLVVCMPFALLYLYNIWLEKLNMAATVGGYERLNRLINVFRPQSLTLLPWVTAGTDTAFWCLALHLVLLVLGWVWFVWIMNRRWDSGE